mgnify:FL=1
MTKDVFISIKGLQFEQNAGIEDESPIEVITKGDYYKKNGKHYVVFEEMAEDGREKTRNLIKFAEKQFDLQRKGSVNVHMVFDENRKTQSYYGTPFGNILIGIDTENVSFTETEDRIRLSVDYSLDVNYEFLAECKIAVDISPRESGVHLC